MYDRYEQAFAGIEAPFAFVDLDAVKANADTMLRSAAGKPIRIASKSVRSRPLLERLLGLDPGFRGLLNLTLPEALWLYEHGFRNLVVAYPWTGRAALDRLAELTATDPQGARPAVMVDSTAQLDLMPAPLRVCLDLDVGYWPLNGLIKIGPKRSPIRTPGAARALAQEIARGPGLTLVGVMAYEGQIAGVAETASRAGRLENLAILTIKRLSARDVAERRAAMVAAVQAVTPLEFVNGGGTGSIASTVAEAAVTEVAAGSGFYAPMLFQYYRSLQLRPAAGYALPIVRKPSPKVATALGGGYIASGPTRADRQPVPALPTGLKLDPFEGAGEAQTPLHGPAAARLQPGDRVYLRHAKAGELCERFNSLYLVEGDRVIDEIPTYRGEGRAFL